MWYSFVINVLRAPNFYLWQRDPFASKGFSIIVTLLADRLKPLCKTWYLHKLKASYMVLVVFVFNFVI